MFAVAWRHNANSPWTLLKDVETSEGDARTKINQFGKYDSAPRQYRIVPLGDADTWHDPVAEDKAAKEQGA